jgi:DNA-binding transcriptional MerR regulator
MSTSSSLSIGVLARKTGCTVPTIRYYEEIGLLPAGPRTEAGRRVYAEAAVRRLSFIRRCRDFGFSLEQVRELVGLVDEPARPCIEVRAVAARHLAQLREKLSELKALERSMSAFVQGCDTACAGGSAIDCTILEDLASPAEDASEARMAAAIGNPSSCCGGRSC